MAQGWVTPSEPLLANKVKNKGGQVRIIFDYDGVIENFRLRLELFMDGCSALRKTTMGGGANCFCDCMCNRDLSLVQSAYPEESLRFDRGYFVSTSLQWRSVQIGHLGRVGFEKNSCDVARTIPNFPATNSGLIDRCSRTERAAMQGFRRPSWQNRSFLMPGI